MKKLLLIVSMLMLTLGLYAQHTITIRHTYYTNYFDTVQRAEILGYYLQTKAHADSSNNKDLSIDRKDVNVFKQDPLIPKYYQSIVTNETYVEWNRANPTMKIDRGHINPYSAMSFNMIAALESMYLENTNVQASYFNEHQWEAVEMIVLKKLSPTYGDIKVWTGSLISTSHARKVGGLYMPDYYWKVVQYVKNGQVVEQGWLGANDFTNKDTNPDDIIANVDHLKTVILQYYPKLKLNF